MNCEVRRSEADRDNTVNDTDGVTKVFGTYNVSKLKSTHMQEHETSNGPASDPMALLQDEQLI